MNDDPELDGTDGAHPAWWRGCDHGTAMTVSIINEILDGGYKSGRFGFTPLERLRSKLYDLMEKKG